MNGAVDTTAAAPTLIATDLLALLRRMEKGLDVAGEDGAAMAFQEFAEDLEKNQTAAGARDVLTRVLKYLAPEDRAEFLPIKAQLDAIDPPKTALNRVNVAKIAALMQRAQKIEGTDRSGGYALRVLGDPGLHAPCRYVEAGPDANHLPAVVAALLRERARHRGLALSANQIGSDLRVFVALLGGEELVCVNARIVDQSVAVATCAAEGCLSIPDSGIGHHYFRTSTQRHTWIRLAFQDETLGSVRTKRFEGLDAQVVQHELMHMEGTTLLDLPHITRQQRRQAKRMVADWQERQERERQRQQPGAR